MKKKKGFLKILLSIVMTLVISFTVTAPYTKAAAVVPKLQMITPAAGEYHLGDKVSFTVASPNYKGKVEYRVILYNGTTKKTSELWPTMQEYYYKNWQPSGNYNFTINWPVAGMEAGAYSLTVLVRRVGAKVPYDSFVKTNAFWIKTEEESAEALQETAAQELVKQEAAVKEPVTSEKDPLKETSPEPTPTDKSTDTESEKLSDTYYENIEGGYKIRFPENWEVIENKDEGVTSTIAFPINSESSSIVIVSGSGLKGVSLETAKEVLYDSYIKLISKDTDSWKEISSKKVTLANKKEAYFSEYSAYSTILDVKVPISYYILFTISYNKIYIVTALVDTEVRDSRKVLLEQALLSIMPSEGTYTQE